ncbi:MAG: hypothetical protein NUV65_06980, partial [Candidatus Roizmanbacteria bacterium]|nr:hypothetical protein [Candidatus Roizmanbacteria bacterium]
MKQKPKPTQQELGEFVAREVLTCQSSLVDFLMMNESLGDFDFENVTNYLKTNEQLLDEGYTQEQIDNDDID